MLRMEVGAYPSAPARRPLYTGKIGHIITRSINPINCLRSSLCGFAAASKLKTPPDLFLDSVVQNSTESLSTVSSFVKLTCFFQERDAFHTSGLVPRSDRMALTCCTLGRPVSGSKIVLVATTPTTVARLL